MFEVGFALIAALIVIFVAGMLVRWQNKRQQRIDALRDQIENESKEAAAELEALTGKKVIEYSLPHLENSMDALNKCLNDVANATPSRLERRRKKGVKSKKNVAND